MNRTFKKCIFGGIYFVGEKPISRLLKRDSMPILHNLILSLLWSKAYNMKTVLAVNKGQNLKKNSWFTIPVRLMIKFCKINIEMLGIKNYSETLIIFFGLRRIPNCTFENLRQCAVLSNTGIARKLNIMCLQEYLGVPLKCLKKLS